MTLDRELLRDAIDWAPNIDAAVDAVMELINRLQPEVLWEGTIKASYEGAKDGYIAPPILPIAPGTRVAVVVHLEDL
jgi:hypothetical protein